VTLASAPYLAAYILTPHGEVFSGLLSNPQDGNSYLAKMRQGFDGRWLFHLSYTAEEHSGAPLFLLHIILGKLAYVFSLDLVFAYHLARAAFGLLLLYSIHCLYVKFTADKTVRRSAFLLLAFGSGLSWLTSIWGYLATDLTIPESNTFHTLYANPHFSFALAAFIWGILFYMKAIEENNSKFGLLSGVLIVAAIIALPFFYLTIAALGLVWSILYLKSAGNDSMGKVLKEYALLVLIPLPFLLVIYLPLYNDPVLARWTSQNMTLSPPPWDYALGYGFPLVMAVFGIRALWTGKGIGSVEGRFVLLWIVAVCIMLYLPVAFQRRLSTGLHIPLSLAAGFGLVEAMQWIRLKRPLFSAAIALSALTSLFLVITAVLGALHLSSPFYISEDEVRAYNWLRENTEESDIVMAGRVSGNQIPAWTGRRVVWGHPFETIDSELKLKSVEEFYSGALSADESVRTLTDTEATILYYGQMERKLGTLPEGIDAVTHPIYSDRNVEIFRIDRGVLKK